MPSESPAAKAKTPASAKQASPESNVKDTVESILVAFILAFIFRAFVVEAFVIPTGSMAPTLMGAHMHFRCPDCGYQFDVNFNNNPSGSDEVDIPNYAQTLGGEPLTYDNLPGNDNPVLHCPNCGREIPRNNPADPDNDAISPPVYYGDRILVLKYLYLFQAPHRWDVVVFKAPNEKGRNYSENYIKRLVGLPGETIVVLDGDVYLVDPATGEYKIQRKPYSVQRDLWRIVYDNDFVPQNMTAGLVPLQSRIAAWQQPWKPESTTSGWTLTTTGPDGKPLPDPDKNPSRVFTFNNATGQGTLKFDASANEETHALTDWLGYDQIGNRSTLNPVSDLKLSCFYERRAGDGAFSLELTKRHDVFTAEITRGQARVLDTDDRTGATTVLATVKVPDLDGPGPAQIEFANCDYRVWLRVNDKEVFQTTDAQYHPDTDDLLKHWLDELPMPTVRLLAEKQDCRIEHLSLWHDIYYINHDPQHRIIWATPEQPMVLKADPKEYFVMGDNSPISGDARMWTDDVHLPAEMLDVKAGRVPEQFMLGKAFFVYWPAGYRPFSKTIDRKYPVPNPGIIPDFGDMRSIH